MIVIIGVSADEGIDHRLLSTGQGLLRSSKLALQFQPEGIDLAFNNGLFPSASLPYAENISIAILSVRRLSKC